MNKTIVFAFIFGAAIGSAITWKLVKTKYERIAQEEIDSVKETFSQRKNTEKISEEPQDEAPKTPDLSEKPSLTEYAKILRDEGYTVDEKGGVDMKNRPYIITPDEFGELDGYDAESLTYYADGVLTDDWDKPIEDVDDLVGEDSLTHFGEYEEDSVFVRNDRYSTDYEILRDNRTFSEIKGSHKADNE